MYALLLVLGAVITAAGTAMMAAGFASQAHPFDGGVVTPGMVAFVGGLILIGLGLATRALNRIELALAARPMPRAARPGEIAAPGVPAVATVAVEQASPAARIPFPAKPKAVLTPAHAQAGTAILPAPAEDAGFDLLREKFPNLARIDAPAVAEETDVSLLPVAPVPAEVHVGEANNGVVVHHMNGTAAAAKAAPQADVAPRPAKPQKVSVFDTFWPKAQRAKEAPPVPMPAQATLPPQQEDLPQPSTPLIEVAPAPPPQPAPVQRETPRPVSVLKSGVVDGMAYTLYSDGSIEAQLPQGTLRFGSINELRNHIEQTS
jgi:hypothetical protein